MDILEPELIWVEGRCYRFCDKYAWSNDKNLEPYEEEFYDPDVYSSEEESGDDPIEVVPFKGNNFKHSFYVNRHFFGFIIGKKGGTLKRLMDDTKTKIVVPRMGQDGNIEITGTTRRAVIAARRRIDMLIETSRNKLDFTHFLSIPGTSDEVRENFEKFKSDVLSKYGTGVRGISEGLFQDSDKLHLTLAILVLLDENDRRKAIEALEACKKDIVQPVLEKSGPVTIEFRGVEIMNDDPSEVNILYIQVHDKSGCLQKISDDIGRYFDRSGLAIRQRERVKLHMTAMNTHFLRKLGEENEDYKQKMETFDATNILKEHSDTYFGKMAFSTIYLLTRHAKTEDGLYQVTAKIEFS
ncbi:hypothetical protein QAD02_017018 [Eretmocerus hayati]|uniref:Uncharacterized protein n=1 Tax=Eretmocerus hayati TaxID=131215 RepID=A0ACC2PCP4_9HYME|nr:hypothetical protein QAD02_017018 [Eretmocerus hayati]